MATSDATAAIAEQRMMNEVFMRPTLEIQLKTEAKSRQRTSREARLKVFLAGRIAVETEGLVIDERHFPGRHGRLLFAYLVLADGRPVPRDELADVLWGDGPPPTWEKALSVHVSKLRGVLAESGLDGASALTAAVGCYQLDLREGIWVDILAAEHAANEAEGFLETEELESAKAAAALAESVTRGSFLPGDDGPWVDQKRRELAEIRAQALSALAEASLRTDKPAEAVRWARLAVEAEPFRESGYRRLMEAHVATGNRAEALQVYERCRQLLAEELGAYPSPETEAVYRSLLEAPSGRPVADAHAATSVVGAGASRASLLTRPALAVAALVVLVVVGTAIAVVAPRGGGAGTPSAAGMPRIALVLPRAPVGGGDSYNAPYESALGRARTEDSVQTQAFTIDPARPGLPQDVRQNIGSFGLVLLAGPLVGNRFVHVMARHPHTRFVVIDPPNTFSDTPLSTAVTRDANADDIFFATGPTAYLAGYLTALMGTRRDPGKRQTVVSMIGSDFETNANELEGFTQGVKAADPRVTVLVNYANDSSDPSVCERIANHQIAQGSTTVYADAGTGCSTGALSAAAGARIWAVGSDPSSHGAGILASTVKRLGAATTSAITLYLGGALPGLKHHHFDIGIERGAIALVDYNRAVPASVLTKLAQQRQELMSYWKTFATPQN